MHQFLLLVSPCAQSQRPAFLYVSVYQTGATKFQHSRSYNFDLADFLRYRTKMRKVTEHKLEIDRPIYYDNFFPVSHRDLRFFSLCFYIHMEPMKFSSFQDFNFCQEDFLTLVATALCFHVVSWPQVALNLAAQVTCDLAVRQHTPSLLPPHLSCRRALDTVSIFMINFNIVSVAC